MTDVTYVIKKRNVLGKLMGKTELGFHCGTKSPGKENDAALGSGWALGSVVLLIGFK